MSLFAVCGARRTAAETVLALGGACILVLLVAGSPAPAAAAGTLTAATPRTRASFDRETGALVSLHDNETEREWLAPDGGARLYEITLARTGQEPLRLSLAQATGVKVRAQLGEVQISVDAHGDVPVGVRMTFAPDTALPQIVCRITVKFGTEYQLQSVRFPVLAVPARLGDAAEDDRVLLPHCDGLEVQNPEANFKGARVAQYPGGAAMQFLSLYDAEGGLYLAALDSEGHRKQIGVGRAGQTLEPILTHYPPLNARVQWSPPYRTAIETFPGDWQTPAEMYRAWAQKQSWCRTPLAKRKDVPAWAFAPAFYYAVSLRGDAPKGESGERVPLLPAQVDSYRKAVGAPVVAMLMSWEKQGSWVTPDTFPPYAGDDAFKALTAQLHKDGNRALVFLSGLNWTLRKKMGDTLYESEAAFKERAEKWAIVGEDGAVQRAGKPEGDVGEYARICPATPLAGEILSEMVRRCQDLGVDAVQVDQIVGGGMPPCYSKEHGHPAGGGNWSARAVYALFEQVRKEGRSRSKDFLLLMEEPGEYFIPVLDAYHARDYAEGRWPRDGAGVRGVPLFTYVYHDHCLGYGGDSAPLGPWGDRFNAYQHALNLVHGKMPAGAVWGRWQPANDVHADQVAVLRNAGALLASPAGEFLLKGRRTPAPVIRSTPLALRVPRAGIQEERLYPSVLAATYALPEGRVGRIYVNLGMSKERVQVSIPAMGMTGQRVRLTTYRAEDGEVTQDSDTQLTPALLTVMLPPMAAALVESAPAGWEVLK